MGRLADAAKQWAEYRTGTGRSVATYSVPPVTDHAVLRERILDRIAVFAAHAGDTPAVLLLGDAVPDQDSALASIPTWLFPQTDPTLRSSRDSRYATDHPYQLPVRPDAAPRIALGRVPARTNDQALQVLDKIRRYESQDATGPWRRRIA